MADADLAYTPAWQLRQLLDSRQVSPVELTELYLRRIEELDPQLNSYLTVSGDQAMASARDAEQRIGRSQPGGPLLGIPVSIKDLDITKGIRSTMGSLAFKGTVPQEDSAAAARIRQAGAVVLGKTNTPEFGSSGTTQNRLADHCRNPWNPERTAGGSSGGAGAALAAGLCPLASGSDAGGSIRIPSSFCGTYGIKPTLGRVPRVGGYGRPGPNLVSCPGPMTRTVRDAAMFLQVLAGYDPRDAIGLNETPPDFVSCLDQGVKGLRLAWSPDLGHASVDPEVMQVTSQAARVFEELGCTVEESNLSLESPFSAFLDIFTTSTYVSYGHLPEDQLTDYVKQAMEHARSLTAADYARSLGKIQVLRATMAGLFRDYDLLLTPTMAVPPFPVGQAPREIGGKEVHPLWGYLPFTYVFNLTGQPAASVPCGFSREGLPIGLHIVGRVGEETTVLRASAAFEEARPWGHHRPPVS